jgi:hypothetical protein
MEMADRRSVTVPLVGAILILAFIGVALFVPVVKCDNCVGIGEVPRDFERWWRECEQLRGRHIEGPLPNAERVPCGRCRTTGRITLYQVWRFKLETLSF